MSIDIIQLNIIKLIYLEYPYEKIHNRQYCVANDSSQLMHRNLLVASWEASLVLCTKGVREEGRALAAPGVGRGEAPFNKVEAGVGKGIEKFPKTRRDHFCLENIRNIHTKRKFCQSLSKCP